MWKKFKIGTRISIALAVPCILMALIAAYVHFGSKGIIRTTESTIRKEFGLALEAQQMKVDVIQIQQWLTDISATKGQDGLDDGYKKAEEHYKSFNSLMANFIKHFKEDGLDQSATEMETIGKRFDEFYSDSKAMADAYIKDGTKAGNKMMGTVDKASEDLAKLFDPFVKQQTEDGMSAYKSINDALAGMAVFAVVVCLISIALSALFTVFVTRSINADLNNTVLTIAESLKKSMTELRAGSKQLESASSEVSSGSQSVSQSSNRQASSIEETSASLEEINGQVNQNVDAAKQATELAANVVKITTEADAIVTALQVAMNEILKSNERIEQIAKIIDNIGEKTDVMDEIVFQTKLLSFNASVEAERAGEHGRGFAVVAQEVGNLAQMSGKAAQEIAQIVKTSIHQAQSVASENRKSVEQGGKYVESTTKILREIKANVSSMSTGANQVLTASKEQASGIKQINIAISELDKAIQESAGISEETATSAEELASQAETINNIIAELDRVVRVDLMKLAKGNRSSTDIHDEHNEEDYKPKLITKNKKTNHAPVIERARKPDIERPVSVVASQSQESEWDKL